MYRKLTILLILLSLALIIYSCGGSKALLTKEAILEDIGIAELPIQEDYPDEEGVYLVTKYEEELNIDSNWELFNVTYKTEAKLIFRNIEDHDHQTFYLDRDEELQSIEALTIKPTGEVITVKPEDILVTTGTTDLAENYSKRKKYSFTYPSATDGSILIFNIKYKAYQNLSLGNWYIQNELPTLKSYKTMTVPSMLLKKRALGGIGWDYFYKSYNFDLPDPEFQKVRMQPGVSNEKYKFVWDLRNIPAYKFESNMPPFQNTIAKVSFKSHWAKTWDDISTRYYEKFFEPEMVSSPEIKSLAKELTEGTTTQMEATQAIYNYVGDIRYVSIDIGDSGLRPKKPAEVLKNNYGDCKEKSLLMLMLLKEVGIEAKPVLLLTNDEGYVDVLFPNFTFNHMILKVENLDNDEKNTFFIDATVSNCKLGELPGMDEDVNVLVLNEDGTSKLERTPDSSYRDNDTFYKVDVTLNDDLSADYKIVLAYKGNNAIHYKGYIKKLNQNDFEDFCKAIMGSDFVSATVSNASFTTPEELNKPFVLQFDIKLANAIRQQGDLFFLKQNFFKPFYNISWLQDEEREHDIDLGYPEISRKMINIHLPDDKLQIRNLPSSFVKKNDHIVYQKKFNNVSAGLISMEEVLIQKDKMIPVDDYKSFKQDIEFVYGKLKEEIILNHL